LREFDRDTVPTATIAAVTTELQAAATYFWEI
jgi:hypothetical protein